ncbi:MAG: S-layer homology domain-containing protein [Candidatus Sericytochromatia bacterium]|nr:S-layer homology domain-containing protein [Candidatus Sericytochromatia bacterium]
MPPPPRKKPAASAPAPEGRRGPRAGKRKKRARGTALPLVLGGTVLVLLVALVAGGIYLTEYFIPTPPPAVDPAAVRRPTVEATVDSVTPKRPGLVLHAEDQVYTAKATDVVGKPLEGPVNGLLARGVLTAFADGTFRPDEPVPRAEFVVWCYNAMMAQTSKGEDPFTQPKRGVPEVSVRGDEFEDVAADHWAAPVIASLKAARYFGEKSPKTFRPDAPLKRQEWALHTVQWCASREQVLNLSRQVDTTRLAVALRKLHLTDAAQIDGIYKPFVWFVVADEKRAMWLQGTFAAPVNPGPWHPRKVVTRGEAATFIGGFYEEIGKAFL